CPSLSFRGIFRCTCRRPSLVNSHHSLWVSPSGLGRRLSSSQCRYFWPWLCPPDANKATRRWLSSSPNSAPRGFGLSGFFMATTATINLIAIDNLVIVDHPPTNYQSDSD